MNSEKKPEKRSGKPKRKNTFSIDCGNRIRGFEKITLTNKGE